MGQHAPDHLVRPHDYDLRLKQCAEDDPAWLEQQLRELWPDEPGLDAPKLKRFLSALSSETLVRFIQVGCCLEPSWDVLVARYEELFLAPWIPTEEARDAVLSVFIRNRTKRFSSFDQSKGSFCPYLRGGAIKVWCKLWRKRRKEQARTVGLECPGVEEQVATKDDAGDTERDCILQMIPKLPERFRELVELRHLEELKLEEIAHRLGEPLSTIRDRLQKAYDCLARLLHKPRPRRTGGQKKVNKSRDQEKEPAGSAGGFVTEVVMGDTNHVHGI